MITNRFSSDVNILTITKTKAMLPIGHLSWLVVRYAYNRNGEMNDWLSIPDAPMTRAEIADMMSSVVNWLNYIRVEKDKMADKYGAAYMIAYHAMECGKRGHPLDEKELALQKIGWILSEADGGKIAHQKKRFIEHRIDYKKNYGMSEAFNPKDFVRAQEALKKAMQDNPDDYK